MDLAAADCARIALDTRLGPGEWRSPATAAQVESAIARADVVVTTRLHGLVLALKNGIPVLAVDPVAGGATVAAQAAAWDWPVLTARAGNPVLDRGELDHLWAWCRSPEGIARARAAVRAVPGTPGLTADLLRAVAPPARWDVAAGKTPAGG